MSHPLEEELKQFIVQQKASRLGDFTNEYYSHPLVHHIQVIACKLLVIDPAPFNQIFKQSRDATLIEELIESYGLYPELADFFIPKTVLSASIYKKLANLEQAEDLILSLIENSSSSYLEEVYNLKDRLFEGEIGIKIKQFNPAVNDPFNWIENVIANKEGSSPSDSSSKTRYEDFYFYKLNNFSRINKSLEEDFYRLVESPKKAKKIPSKKNTISLYLQGKIEATGVVFSFSINNAADLYHGIPSTSLTLPANFGSFLKEVLKEGVNGQAINKIKEYLISYVPGLKEAQLVADLGEVILKNTFKSDPHSLIKVMNKHFEQLNELNITIKEYYIEHYLPKEFQEFFDKKDFPLQAKDFTFLYNDLYNYYIQNVKNFLSVEEEEMAQQLIAAHPSKDADTIKFKCAYHALFSPEAKGKRRLFSKRRVV